MRRRPRNVLLLVLATAALTGCQNAAVDSVPAEPNDPVPPAVEADDTPEVEGSADAAAEPAAEESDPVGEALPVKRNPMVKKIVRAAYNDLTPEEERVILRKGTERAFTGEYTDLKAKGTFICRRCNAPLYTSDAKFDSDCGWPSFDEDVAAAVERHPDPDGFRTEIVCANCGGHLGHVFEGERFTEKNTRHCVNSISMKFVPEGQELPAVIVPEEEPRG